MAKTSAVDVDGDAWRYATGTTPCDALWDRARAAHEAADALTLAAPSDPTQAAVRAALDAFGALLAVWDGYGEAGGGA